MKLADIAQTLGCELHGDANLEITGVAGIEEAKAGELTFLANRKYHPLLATTARFGDHRGERFWSGGHAASCFRQIRTWISLRAIELFHPAPAYAPGVHPTAVIAKSAKLADGAHIGPYCFVDEEVEIGVERSAAQLRHHLSRR